MESLVPILIAVAFFVLQAIASNNKKKEIARRQAQRTASPQEHAPHPAAEPQKNLFEQLLESMREQGAIGEVEEEAIEEPDEEREEVEKILYPAYTKIAAEETPAAGSVSAALESIAATTSDEEKIAFTEPQKKKHWFIAEAFDAKKAIVYSEIMQPKFDR